MNKDTTIQRRQRLSLEGDNYSSNAHGWRRKPSWRISRMEFVDPFGWHILDGEGFQRIHKKLSQFESMTWAEILIDDKKFNHMVSVDDLCSEAKNRLTEIGQADVEELVLLRLSGRERIWGKLDQGVMTVIWWDPNHEVCPSLLKHT